MFPKTWSYKEYMYVTCNYEEDWCIQTLNFQMNAFKQHLLHTLKRSDSDVIIEYAYRYKQIRKVLLWNG